MLMLPAIRAIAIQPPDRSVGSLPVQSRIGAKVIGLANAGMAAHALRPRLMDLGA
jgi:hypothetical protein